MKLPRQAVGIESSFEAIAIAPSTDAELVTISEARTNRWMRAAEVTFEKVDWPGDA